MIIKKNTTFILFKLIMFINVFFIIKISFQKYIFFIFSKPFLKRIEFDDNSKVVDIKSKPRQQSLSYQVIRAQYLERFKTHFAISLPPIESAPSTSYDSTSKGVKALLRLTA